MLYVNYEKMTEEEFEAAMRRQAFFCEGAREMGFWRKTMVFLWVLIVTLTMLALIGLVPLSVNAMAAGIVGIAGIPAALLADYHINFKKGW